MEIKLTDNQYKKLTELLYFSDLFLDSPSKLFSEEQVEEYENLLNHIYSYSNNDVRISSIRGIFGKTSLSEKDSDKIEGIFNDQLKRFIYHYLAEGFVRKDFPNIKIIEETSNVSALSVGVFISGEMQKYLMEFKENDLKNIRFKLFKKPQENNE